VPPLSPGSWWQKAVDMIRPDLEAVTIPYVIEGPEGPL
jgi:hypothetical protein